MRAIVGTSVDTVSTATRSRREDKIGPSTIAGGKLSAAADVRKFRSRLHDSLPVGSLVSKSSPSVRNSTLELAESKKPDLSTC